jgi:hypothetical protein
MRWQMGEMHGLLFAARMSLALHWAALKGRQTVLAPPCRLGRWLGGGGWPGPRPAAAQLPVALCVPAPVRAAPRCPPRRARRAGGRLIPDRAHPARRVPVLVTCFTCLCRTGLYWLVCAPAPPAAGGGKVLFVFFASDLCELQAAQRCREAPGPQSRPRAGGPPARRQRSAACGGCMWVRACTNPRLSACLRGRRAARRGCDWERPASGGPVWIGGRRCRSNNRIWQVRPCGSLVLGGLPERGGDPT